VTKRNHDIEEQIADLLAYVARLKYLNSLGRKITNSNYDKMILSVLGSKIFLVPSNAKKTKFFNCSHKGRYN
jgi:hypothetical protein